ncbi:uncharacterized protein LOC106073534 [Biomphalaria glabrata]|uniref:Uncharacterized protein LOC106073534 n=1 Tax=Biomphalaria glabrata TaxID=6526 RepID=A0A9W2YKU4_BIOGL|nr:uncharacterized protein LOC106073534 [Biomphalaria glabrata]
MITMTCTLYSMNWFQRFVCCWLSILLLNTFFQTLTLGSSDNGHRVAKSDFKSFKNCEHNYTFRGEILNSTVRSVRSEIECASQCLGNSLCAAYNLIKLSNARFSLKSCEILSNSATNCKDLQETPLSKYKFLFRTNSGNDNGNSGNNGNDNSVNNGNDNNVNNGNDNNVNNGNDNSETSGNGNNKKEIDATTLMSTPLTTVNTYVPSTTLSTTTSTPKTTTSPTTTATTSTSSSYTTTAGITTTTTPTTASVSSSTTTLSKITTTSSVTTSSSTTLTSSTATTTPKTTTTSTVTTPSTTTSAVTTPSTTASTSSTSTTTPKITTTSTVTTPSTTTSTVTTTSPTTSTSSSSTRSSLTTSDTATCSSKWFTTSSSSNPLVELTSASQNGSAMIVQYYDTSSKRTWSTVAREYTVTSTQFCVQLTVNLLTNSWRTLNDTTQWIFRQVCTTGVMDEYTVSGVSQKKNVDVTWSYRRNTASAADSLINLNNGDIVQGNRAKYQQLVRNGSSLSVLLHDSNNGLGKKEDTSISQSFSVYQNPPLLLQDGDETFGAFNVLSFGKRTSSSKPHLQLNSFNTEGKDYTEGYDLDTFSSLFFTQTNYKQSWILDPCWSLVHSSTTSTSRISTSASLLSAVRAGKRIKVSVTEDDKQSVYSEADQILITSSGVVVAQLISLYTKDFKLEKDGAWYLYFIHSNGQQCRYEIPFSESTVRSTDCSQVNINWYAETRVPEVVYKTDTTGKVLLGSKANLRTVGDLRVMVQLPNDNNLERYLTLETTELDSELNFSALSMRNLRSTYESSSYMKLDSSCLGVAYLVTTDSKVATRYWRPGRLTSDTVSEQSANVTWFMTK